MQEHSKETIEALIHSLPKPTESEQAAIDIVIGQVAEEMARNRKQDSLMETLTYLRSFLPFEDVLNLAKKIGDSLKQSTQTLLP